MQCAPMAKPLLFIERRLRHIPLSSSVTRLLTHTIVWKCHDRFWPLSTFVATQHFGNYRSNSGCAADIEPTLMTLGGHRASMKDGALSRPLNEQRPDFTIAVLDHRTDTNANAKAAVTRMTGL
jgi:hypothetical protein